MFKNICIKALGLVLVFTIICGVIYTLVLTGVGQVIFPYQSNGSIIEINGVKYGSELLGQRFTDEKHMWGRVMNIDVSTFKDENGNPLMYAAPSNLSVTSEEYNKLISERVEMLQKYHGDKEVPVDLVTCSGSGLDPHISIAAARYQVDRIAKANDMSENEVNDIIDKCTQKKFLGLIGEDVVNVLKVNLMIEGILKS